MLAIQCVEPYDPPIVSRETNYLVVDAFLDAGNGVASVKLTRTIPVYADQLPPAEKSASVTVEDESGNAFTLTENADGLYTRNNLPVSIQSKYRLHIKTADNQDFRSEFIAVRSTPPLDSIYWLPERDGITIYADTHDDSGNSRFYKWDFVETYEYNSPFNSDIKFQGSEVVPRPLSESIYKCWKTEESSLILVGTTKKLSKDVISHFPITFHQVGSIKTSRKYTILVRQKVISEEAYNYWRELQLTTESLGGLFDPMPSQVTGNMRNESNPSEPVLGFFSGGSVQEKRIYISFADLPDYLKVPPPHNCLQDTIPTAELSRYPNTILLVLAIGAPIPYAYTTAPDNCIDCRLKGGVTTPPDFWE
jgi:hypothetical protein